MMKKAVFILPILIAVFLSSIQPFSVFADTFSDNYYELSWIESSGDQYIDSGITSTKGYFEYKVQFSSVYTSSTRNRLMGLSPGTGVADLLDVKSSQFGYGYVGSYQEGFTYSANTDYVVNVNLGGSSETSYFTVNGGTQLKPYSYSSQPANGSNYGIGLFGYNNRGTHTKSNYSFRLYYLKYFANSNSSSPSVWLVPAMRKNDNAIGLYDKINDVFHNNEGNTAFQYGGATPTQYTITTSVSPSGSGTVTGGGTYDANTSITLTATPNTGYEFIRWSDNVYDNPRTVLVTSTQSYQAIFQQQSTPVTRYTVSTSVSPSGSGTVTGGGTYDSGSTITLTATANNGYSFSQWSDGVTTSSRTVSVNSDLSFTAQFTSNPTPVERYTISVNASPSAGGTVSGGGTYDIGSSITISAVSNSGYVFSSWSDGITSNPRQLTVTSNASYTAYFTQDVSGQTILGCNISLIDYESGVAYQYWGYFHSTDESIILYPAEYDGTVPLGGSRFYPEDSKVFCLDFVFNDDYIGDFSFRLQSTGGTFIEYRTLFVNGNHAQYSFLYNGDIDLSGAQLLYYNLNHLVKKQTVTTIVNEGTQESIESEQALDQGNEDLSTAVGQFDQIETGFNDDMNDALDEIDTSFSPSSFGSKFQSSAIWVSNQFNELTSDTPFGSVLGFSLLVGISLLIIGKVLG